MQELEERVLRIEAKLAEHDLALFGPDRLQSESGIVAQVRKLVNYLRHTTRLLWAVAGMLAIWLVKSLITLMAGTGDP